ncbi:hypothetical protein LTR84_010747 [Exophiala bonariae]|uniref:DUF1446 domain-containing protein n=1 Tax=Exophiala bonariae TaxID=1690606 RepID=A0AAV9MV51_9EURO|nr:hypothetical protein LTR84_010747 [Exophiala bonariae]
MGSIAENNSSAGLAIEARGTRPIRICGASGSVFDRRAIFGNMVNSSEPIDLIIGDWMSEGNMPACSTRKLAGEPGFEASFLEVLEPVLPKIAERGVKVAVNAGGSDAQLLATIVQKLSDQQNLDLIVAWVSGDDVFEQVNKHLTSGKAVLNSIDTGEQISDWKFKPVAAQAYLGAFGVAKAFELGANIVICGRVADASPTIGGAIWWYNWTRDNLQELAFSLVAGHLVECSTYITGANFSGFKSIPRSEDPGLPIAEIHSNGEFVITKLTGSGGAVTTETVKAQLLYEIQGPWYFNSDVTAVLDEIRIDQLEPDVVAISGITALPPPVTTKVGISGVAGYSAELHWAIVGLDVQAKAKMIESHLRLSLGEERIKKLSLLKFTTNGTAAANPRRQNDATVDFRIFAQAQNEEDLSTENFMRPVWDIIMCTYPGATPHAATNAGLPRPWFEYWVTLLDQAEVRHVVHLPNNRCIEIPPPTRTRTYPLQQPSYDPTNPTDLSTFGETVECPIGFIVHARSGDKGCNANVGFFVRYEDEYEWLRSLLTIQKMKQLLRDEYSGNAIDRFELPNIWAVHFVCHQHLDRGINSSSTYDILGKNLGEFLRAQHVAVPTRFLDRGRI